MGKHMTTLILVTIIVILLFLLFRHNPAQSPLPAENKSDQVRMADLPKDEAELDAALVAMNVPDRDTLINALNAECLVVEFDPEKDLPIHLLRKVGRQCISAKTLLRSLSIFTPGAPGEFMLGKVNIRAENFDKKATRGEPTGVPFFQQLGQVMGSDGVLQIYSSRVAADSSGQALLDKIAETTGHTVFASAKPIGKDVWALEATAGEGGAFQEILDTKKLAESYGHDLSMQTEK